jgi:hypothetical protein
LLLVPPGADLRVAVDDSVDALALARHSVAAGASAAFAA